MAKKPPKFEALVVNAIRRLQAAQGSTEAEIANYLSQEYNVAGPEVRKQIQLTLKRGMNYGILHKSKRGYVTCDRNIPDVLDVADCSHRRGSRRRGRSSMRKSSRRGRSRSKKMKRAGCSTCPRRRAAVPAGVRSRPMKSRPRARPRVKRMTRRAPPRAAREKVKKTPSSEETSPTATNGRSSAKGQRDPRKQGEENSKTTTKS